MLIHLPPLIIAGMHRSGTSLVANWLSNCGLDIGEKLVQADFSNAAGHYEDWAFLDLHRDILAANDTDHLIADGRQLIIGPEHRARAEQLVAERTGRSGVDQWGWKEPRTTVLLDFWHTLLPEMRVLVIYRHYAQVADSILRRDLNRKRHKPNWSRKARRLRAQIRLQHSFLNVPQVRTYLRVWNRYNQDALAFARAFPAQTLVLQVNDVLANGKAVIAYLNQMWGYHLQAADTREVYDPTLMRPNALPVRAAWSALLAPACPITLHELDIQRQESLARLR